MNVKVIFACLFLTLLLIFHSEAYININIDPEDMDRVSDFFHTIMVNQQPPRLQSSTSCVSIVKKAIYSSIHLVGVMLSLVGASALSSYLSLNEAPIQYIRQAEVQNQNISRYMNRLKSAKTCSIDFGCHHNVCWRMCHADDPGLHLWCHTASNPLSRKLQHCRASADCSICWECIETCHP